MRGSVFLLFLSGCIALPEANVDVADASSDASPMDAARLDASTDAAARNDARVDASIRDAGADARADAVVFDANVVDASIDATNADAAVDAMIIDASVASPIRISEVRTRGPSGGNDEFVEIVNTGDAPVDISGYKLRAASASGSVGTRVVVAAGVVLVPGESFLFANSGASGYSGGTTPDATYTFGLADECGIAIADATGIVIDAFGTLVASTLYEGSVRAPLTENADRSHARRRTAEGVLVDTQDNLSDFETAMPATPTSGLP